MRRSGRDLSRHQRVYRTVLLVYPRAFRQVYGADMVQVFGDHLRECREREGRAGTLRVWTRTMLDVFRTAPIERMEVRMSREALFALVYGLILLVGVVTVVLGLGGPLVAIPIIAVLIAGAAFLTTRTKDRVTEDAPAPGFTAVQWWLIPAVLMGVASIAMGARQLIEDPKIENVVALGIFGGAGLLTITGVAIRFRRRRAGDRMIALGMLPTLALFWSIWPPILGIVTIVMALLDSIRSGADPARQPAA